MGRRRTGRHLGYLRSGGSQKGGFQAASEAQILAEIEALVGRGAVEDWDFEAIEVAARAVQRRLNAATSPKAREALAQYIAPPPVSLNKMLVEEHAATVLYRSEYNPYFRTHSRLFPATGFLVELLQHLPDAGTRLIRRYGLYSSRSRGTWTRTPHLVPLAPEGWKKQQQKQSTLRLGGAQEQKPDQSVSANESRAAWARLLAKLYEVDALRCSRCGSAMRVLAVITDPQQVRRILRHLIKTGAAPPGLEPSAVS